MQVDIFAPISGKVLSLNRLETDFFSRTFNNNGIAITPKDNCVFSPVNGRITNVTNTKESFQITSDEGLVINIYVGIKAVSLFGEAFVSVLKKGQKITRHQPLLFFDQELMKKNNIPIVVILTISDLKKNWKIDFNFNDKAIAKKTFAVAKKN